ncbi:hypothetical protein K445DRAFT_70293, partial [Daldinia sp. EC12]
VNLYLATATADRINRYGPHTWRGNSVEFVFSGPNVGSALSRDIPTSGTVGAAAFSTEIFSAPAIDFSGTSEGRLPWNAAEVPLRSITYAKIATKFMNAITDSGIPYLPIRTFLNVNFPKVEGDYTDSDKFKWVLSRFGPAAADEIRRRNLMTYYLTTETSVIYASDCHISISAGHSTDNSTARVEDEAVVLDRL